MLFITITLVYLTSSIAISPVTSNNATSPVTSNDAEWVTFKEKYGKVYSEEEDGWRKEIWMKNTRDIQIHNAQFEER